MATILCIADDPPILEIHQALFGHECYTVLNAQDGPTGTALTRADNSDTSLSTIEKLLNNKPFVRRAVKTNCD